MKGKNCSDHAENIKCHQKKKKVICLGNQATGICGTLVVTTAENYHLVCNTAYFIKKFIHVSEECASSIFCPEERNYIVLHPRR